MFYPYFDQANLISSVDHGSNSLLVFCCHTRFTNLKHLTCISKIPKFNICTCIYLFKIYNITNICVNFYIHLVHAWALLEVINSLVCLHETKKRCKTCDPLFSLISIYRNMTVHWGWDSKNRDHTKIFMQLPPFFKQIIRY